MNKVNDKIIIGHEIITLLISMWRGMAIISHYDIIFVVIALQMTLLRKPGRLRTQDLDQRSFYCIIRS